MAVDTGPATLRAPTGRGMSGAGTPLTQMCVPARLPVSNLHSRRRAPNLDERGTLVLLVVRTVRYVAIHYLGAPSRSSQRIARANAAQASAALRERRREYDDVDAYLRANRSGDA